MFLIFFKLFSTFFNVLLWKKSIYIPIMYSNLPQRLESHWKFLAVYLLPRLQFHELDSLWINLHFLKMNYSDMHFSALQSWTATLCSHNPGAEAVGLQRHTSQILYSSTKPVLSINEGRHTCSCR